MKRTCLFLSLLLAASWLYPADFKIMAGLSLSKSTEPIWGNYLGGPLQTEFGAGLVAGGGIEFLLTRNLAIEADVLFTQKGTRIRVEDMGMPIGHSMARINELSIPVLAKVLFGPGTSPYILGGGEFAFVLTEGQKTVDYGLVGGIGFRKQLKKIGMSLEARYHHGLQDLNPDEVIFPVSPSLRKMRVLSFMLGLSI